MIIILLAYLSKEGIYSLGTIIRNRIPNSKIPTEKVFNKMKRGHSMEFVGNYNDVEISLTTWKDNKTVIMASIFADEKPLGKVMRYDKKTKIRVEIIRPHVIEEYNKHMGGVDLLDSIIARHKILMRSKKWCMRIFFHLLDLIIVNAWLLYKRVETDKKSENEKKKKNLMNLQKFKSEVASYLCKMEYNQNTKRGRPSNISIEQMFQTKRCKGTAQSVSCKDIRRDGINHWPIWSEKRIRCKFPNCKGYNQTECEKRKAGLCYNKVNNCFKIFHCM
ncbi:piggyBac transposable element-derived protein 2 [Nephila pilipes]|uniref:PiggyBac transposable element-derived protein 2 n=1 Tax=Nephila pilipes TaxID=299642 RepID=A0A8X6MQH3_NEPPI|nr:piggyBac transposable element-derived protein 2 [Nephila pilipes]